MHASKEQIKTLTQLSEVEQAASGLKHSVETVSNPGIITKLKRFFGVSKEVKKIKVSITEEHILKQSLRVGKKKLNQRHIAPVIIWDFGGQDIFYSTHQSFLSYRAIYLIVLDGSRTLDEPCQFEHYLPGKSGPKTARDYLRFWINTIVTYCKGSQHGFPKIMIVFTHKDKLKPSEVEKTKEQLFGDVKSIFHESPLMSHLVIEDKIFVNARNKNDPEMAKIRRGIIRESKLQPTWGQNFPKCFIPLEFEFENLIRENMNVITFDDLRKINTQHPIRPLSDAELKVFLKFQHAIGKILYFDEPGLDTHLTLLPTYLIDAFKSIITDKRFCKGEKQREHLWNLMSQKGVISKSAIEKLWRN
ncbi:probable serine/threonine-protein kinase roco5 [Mytilus californianus]|uniref:probable serine/threonine-protein kinase roco5 n=1 Tax=Mytilus californianus TaxID=6549 RepID=UPI0022484C73|nr:probable serine/threonine-protein kinase roco5 [Mytilus californianus]